MRRRDGRFRVQRGTRVHDKISRPLNVASRFLAWRAKELTTHPVQFATGRLRKASACRFSTATCSHQDTDGGLDRCAAHYFATLAEHASCDGWGEVNFKHKAPHQWTSCTEPTWDQTSHHRLYLCRGIAQRLAGRSRPRVSYVGHGWSPRDASPVPDTERLPERNRAWEHVSLGFFRSMSIGQNKHRADESRSSSVVFWAERLPTNDIGADFCFRSTAQERVNVEG